MREDWQFVLAALAVLVMGAAFVWRVVGPAPVAPPVPVTAEVAPVEIDLGPDTVELAVAIRSGDTIGGLLQRHGLAVAPVLAAAQPHYDLTRVRPDRELTLRWTDGDPEPDRLTYGIDEDHTLVLERAPDGWTGRVDEVDYEVSEGSRSLTLTRSLWADGLDAGLRPDDLVRLARAFRYEVDFNTELREGDTFDVAAQVLSLDGEVQKLGELYAVRLVNQGKVLEAVKHVDDSGNQAWFKPDGSALKKPFLRSPLAFSRVTSGFNPKRFHPVLKKRRPHNGTDFGAPTGTPVQAVGDGRVVVAGRSGGHGNFVKIDHGNGYQTSYSHLSRISVRQGQQVKQGEIVGKVGSTGLATGPHLHYQMWRNGSYVDAMSVKLPSTGRLPQSEKAAFQAKVDKWMAMLPTR